MSTEFNDSCLFCKIAKDEINSHKIYEDSSVCAFLDINPLVEGHIILIPKKHYSIMPQIPDEELAVIFEKVQLISHVMLRSLKCDGTSILISNGLAAGQKAEHFMIHIIPRNPNDGLLKLPEKQVSKEDLMNVKFELENNQNNREETTKPNLKEEINQHNSSEQMLNEVIENQPENQKEKGGEFDPDKISKFLLENG